ncbi:RNA-guided endonuclease InsQ/TnpB family protein [Ferrimicrobium acidiphilum]|uniref:RNA-guided endonuclease InsQ/TnpB family protein n=1 Tax=Ferrimicrobium acidiphilum TaxID=121039 RepID=UPI0023F2B0C5|nr:RNA-guided endonuclease TnpB family protein [Ferrimicrobium acidiphilum]
MSETVLRYRYRAYPGREATIALSRTFGSCRVVFNDAIATREYAHKHGLPFPKTKELSRALITKAKKTPERKWLAEVSAVALQQALDDADTAYRNFFRSTKSVSKKRKVGHPKFKSRHDSRQSARFTNAARFKVELVHERQAVLTLPKIGRIPFVLSRPLPTNASSVTVIRESDGRTYLSFVVRVQNEEALKTNRICGIDPGLASYATVFSVDTSTKDQTEFQIDTPALLRRRARALVRSQRALSRKKKGSKNRAKARTRVAVVHRKVRQARLDHAHQQAAQIIANHDIIAVEDPSVDSMARTKLAKSVHDQAMGQFLRLLKEKAERQGKICKKVDRYFPSTQICSSCKSLTGPKGLAELKIRHWICSTCNTSHDRDVNAARNILAEGLRLLEVEQSAMVADGRSETENACGADVRPAAMLAVGEDADTGKEAGRASEDRRLCPA